MNKLNTYKAQTPHTSNFIKRTSSPTSLFQAKKDDESHETPNIDKI